MSDRAQLIYISDLLFVITLYASKVAVAMLLSRFAEPLQDLRCSRFIVWLCALFGVISTLIVAIQNDATTPWSFDRSDFASLVRNGTPTDCNLADRRQMGRWVAVEVLGATADICLVAYPLQIITGLQLEPLSKFAVAIGFVLRLL